MKLENNSPDFKMATKNVIKSLIVTRELLEEVFLKMTKDEIDFLLKNSEDQIYTNGTPLLINNKYQLVYDIHFFHTRIRPKGEFYSDSEINTARRSTIDYINLLKDPNKIPIREFIDIFANCPSNNKKKYGIYAHNELLEIKNDVIRRTLSRFK